MVLAKTRRKGFIEELSEYGLSVSYKSVNSSECQVEVSLGFNLFEILPGVALKALKCWIRPVGHMFDTPFLYLMSMARSRNLSKTFTIFSIVHASAPFEYTGIQQFQGG